MTKAGVMILLYMASLGVTLAASGCSSRGPVKQGLLEHNGIKDAGDLAFVTIRMAERDGCYRITDRATLDRVYQLLNDAEPRPGTKYYRPNMVTLVRKNGSTLSLAFGLYNPGLTWEYNSRPFVEFVKSEVVGKKKYADTSQLPSFSISKVAMVESASKTVLLSAEKAAKAKRGIRLVASAYKPYTCNPTAGLWHTIASFCTPANPCFEATLNRPIRFETLVGTVEPEPPHGSDALRVKTLVVDRMLLYLNDSLLWLAFHSSAGGDEWFVEGPYNAERLGGTEPASVYRGMIGK